MTRALSRQAAERPEATAVIDDPPGGPARTMTFAELDEAASRLAGALAPLGVEPGRSVVVVGYNAPELLVAANAIARAGAVTVPMSYRLTAGEMAHQVADSDAVAVLAGAERVASVTELRGSCPALRHTVAWGASDLPPGWLALDALLDAADAPPPEVPDGGLMLYTSGTTGRSKGAVRAGGAAAAAEQGGGRARAFDVAPGTPHLAAGPLYHSAPFAFSSLATMIGSANVLMRRFDAEDALRLIAAHGVAWTFMAPTLVRRIVSLPREVRERYDTGSLRSVIVAGAPCPMDLKRRVAEVFGPVLYEYYGSSETGMNTLITPSEHERKPGSCGRVVAGQDVKILDASGAECPPGEAGEIWVRAPGMLEGYYNDPEATAASRREGYVTVGDVGYFDEDGYLYVCDRKADMIISGGVNIYCAEIEEVLHAHPGIADAVVVGIPDEDFGERVHAIVQPAPGARPSAEEVMTWVGQHLAGYKRPRSVEFRYELPRDEAGKVRKRDLREPFWSGRATRV